MGDKDSETWSLWSKVRFLLGFFRRATRWQHLQSIMSREAAADGLCRSRSRCRVSFNDRVAVGLQLCNSDDEYDDGQVAADSTSESGSVRILERNRSYGSGGDEDDVDRRAEVFIANFYRQLRLERQVSLELRYCREQSFGSDDTNSCTS